jgi:hypothetical protein
MLLSLHGRAQGRNNWSQKAVGIHHKQGRSPKMKIEEKLDQMGIKIPEAAKPVASYVPFRRVGNLILFTITIVFSVEQGMNSD